MDSSGLAVILTFNRLNHKENENISTLILNCQEQIQRLVYVSQLDTILEVVKDINKL